MVGCARDVSCLLVLFSCSPAVFFHFPVNIQFASMVAGLQIKNENVQGQGTQDTVEKFLNFSSFCDQETEQILDQDAFDEDEFIEPIFTADGAVQEDSEPIRETSKGSLIEIAGQNEIDKKEDIKEFIETSVSKKNGKFSCNPCGKVYTRLHSVREHVINDHVRKGLKYRCPRCTTISGTRNSLRAHITKYHSELLQTGLDYGKFLLEDDSSSAPSTKNDVAATPAEADKETSSDAINLLIKSNNLITSQIEKHSQHGTRKKKDIKRATPSVPERMEEGENDVTTEKQEKHDVPKNKDIQGSNTIASSEAHQATEKRNIVESSMMPLSNSTPRGKYQLPKNCEIRMFMKDNVTDENGKFTCRPCGKEYKSSGGAYVHARDHHLMRGLRYQCPKCHTTSSSYNSLTSHISQKHPELVGTGIEYEQLLEAENSNPFNDKAVEEFFRDNFVPMRNSSAVLLNLCTKCDKFFKTAVDVKVHIREVHFGGVTYQCPKCSYRQKREGIFTRHLYIRHPELKDVRAQECEVYVRQESVAHPERPNNPLNEQDDSNINQEDRGNMSSSTSDQPQNHTGNSNCAEEGDSGISCGGVGERGDSHIEGEDSSNSESGDIGRMAETIRQLKGQLDIVTQQRDDLLITVDKLKVLTELKLKAKLVLTGTEGSKDANRDNSDVSCVKMKANVPTTGTGGSQESQDNDAPSKKAAGESSESPLTSSSPPDIKSYLLKKEGSFFCKGCKEPREFKSYSGFAGHARDIHINAGIKYKCPLSSCDHIEDGGMVRLRGHVSQKHKGFKGVNEKECRMQPLNDCDKVGIDYRVNPLHDIDIEVDSSSQIGLPMPSNHSPKEGELRNEGDEGTNKPNIKSCLLKQGGSFYCKGCKEPRAFKSYTGFVAHANDKHINVGIKYKCPVPSCNLIRPTLSSLRVHVSNNHKGFKGVTEKRCRVQPMNNSDQDQGEFFSQVGVSNPSSNEETARAGVDSYSSKSMNPSPRKKIIAFSKDNFSKKVDGYHCKLCDQTKSYLTRARVLTHIQKKHLDVGMQFKCFKSSCNFKAKARNVLRAHLSLKHPRKEDVQPKVESAPEVPEDMGMHFLAEMAKMADSVSPGAEDIAVQHVAEQSEIDGPPSKIIGNRTVDLDLRMFLKTRVEKSGAGFKCKICKSAPFYNSYQGVRAHAMDKHVYAGTTFMCPVPSCGKIVRSQNSLRSHVSMKHRGYKAGVSARECRIRPIKQEKL